MRRVEEQTNLLCFFEHCKEQETVSHRGQVYFFSFSLQTLQTLLLLPWHLPIFFSNFFSSLIPLKIPQGVFFEHQSEKKNGAPKQRKLKKRNCCKFYSSTLSSSDSEIQRVKNKQTEHIKDRKNKSKVGQGAHFFSILGINSPPNRNKLKREK